MILHQLFDLGSVIHPVLDPLLVAGGAGLSVSWWVRHAIRAPRDPEPELVVDLAEPWIEFIWRTRVAGDADLGLGVLPGTWLFDVQPLTTGLDGHEATIQLTPGKQATSTAIAAADMICSAYELPAGSVIIEPTADRKRSLARLQVIRQSPLYEVNRWAAPSLSLATGLARIGTYADGVPAHVRFWEPGSGATNMLVAGAQGSGKSQFMSLLLAESMRATYVDDDGVERQLVDTYLGCGQRGQSFPDWARCKALRWMATTPQELIWMVWQFRAQMFARAEYLTNLQWTDKQGRVRTGLAHFDPKIAKLPYAQLVIDEAAAVIALHPHLASWLLDIAKMGRKNGMRVVLATQSPSVTELGNNDNLRSMLAAGGVVVFRVGSSSHGSMAFPSGNVGNPADIPPTTPDGKTFQGAGYVAGPDDRATALMRSLLLDDPFAEAHSARVWPIAPVDATGGGELLATFWDRQEARWRGEDPEPGILAAMAEADAAEQLAAIQTGEPRPGPDQPVSPAGGDGKPALELLIMNALADGVDVAKADVVAACAPHWSERSVSKKLRDLQAAGAVANPAKGRWRRA